MTSKQFITYWYTGAAIAGAIVAVVAALLLAIIATARGIRSNAQRIQRVAEEVIATTRPIWNLGEINATAERLMEGVRAIETHASTLATNLEAPRGQGQRRGEE